MLLNCDLGEGLDDVDERVMPFIDMANIACGGHAGDEASMRRCVLLACKHGTRIGAHPSYPDKAQFGRQRPKHLNLDDLTDNLQTQLMSLRAICHAAQADIHYVKPHGALYHDVATDPELLHALFRAISIACPGVPVMLQARPRGHKPPAWADLVMHFSAAKAPPPLWTEAFADRTYTETGELVSREHKGAVLETAEAIVKQAYQLITDNSVITTAGSTLMIQADSVCVHGDTPTAYTALKDIDAQRLTWCSRK
jgi:UPF0271 protein